jgi:DNA replicative helicase MCM subunit Mcm2 (Cdc46/Mcm family)
LGLFVEGSVNKELEDRLIEFYNAYYIEQINEMFVSYPQKRSVLINAKDLEEFDNELANELIKNPDAVIPSANSALMKLSPNPESIDKPVYARFYGLESTTMPLIQDVGSENIGKLLTLDSLVVKRS